jgi:ribosomal-protein-alanine N-acetyltransferase
MKDIDAVFRQFSYADMCKYFDEPPCDMEEARV